MSVKTEASLGEIAKSLRRLTFIMESWVVPELRKLSRNTEKQEEVEDQDGDEG